MENKKEIIEALETGLEFRKRQCELMEGVIELLKIGESNGDLGDFIYGLCLSSAVRRYLNYSREEPIVTIMELETFDTLADILKKGVKTEES